MSATISAIKTTKIPKTSKKTQKKTKKKQSILRNVWANGFLWRHCFFLFFLVFLVFLEFFLVFGSGSFYRLLRLPKTQKPKNLEKKQKKQKKQSILRNVWAKDFLQRHWFFWFFCFFLFFWLSSSFFGFWFRKLLPATKTTKNPKTLNKNTQKKGLSGMCGPRALFRSIVLCGCLVLLKFWLFVFSHALCRLAPTNFSHTSTLMTSMSTGCGSLPWFCAA